MSDDLRPLVEHIGALIGHLAPPERRRLATRIARDLRTANAGRIGKNVEPDGGAMARRRKTSGPKAKKAMFAKIRLARNLKARASNGDEAAIEFTAAASAVARVHQFGLRDRVSRKSRVQVQYAKRALLGFSSGDEDLILKRIEDHLTGGGSAL